MRSGIRGRFRDLDYVLVAVMVSLSVVSCIAIYTATYGKANPQTGNPVLGIPSHILIRQIVNEVLAYAAMYMAMISDYTSLAKWSKPLYAVSIVLLLAVYGFHRVNGAHSWIPLPFIGFQPSELAKLVLIIWTADYMTRMNQRELPNYSFRGLLPIFIAFLIPFGLTYKEPALGQALVMSAILYSMLVMYVSKRQVQIMVLSSVAVIGILVLMVVVFPKQLTSFLEHQHIMKPYQTSRLVSFINPSYDPSGSGYQVMEAQIAIGSGGMFGTGIFKGSQTSGGWIPFQWTDFVFSAIGEQFGFVGSSIVIFLFSIMLHRLIRIATMATDDFGFYIVTGLVGMFAFQVFQNIGMNLSITPATGITLPFISYGGSSLVVNSMGAGMALSVGVRRNTLRFD